MTQFLWDVSAWDWGRGPMDMVAAKEAGIVGLSHRGSTGTIYKDPHLGKGINRALNSGIEVLGSYMVPRTPGNNGNKPLGEQVDFFLSYLNEQVPWWKTWPYWFFQVDTEIWKDGNGKTLDHVSIELGRQACFLISRITKKRVIHYAPKWCYGNDIPGKEPLWASHYTNTPGPFKTIYPGDDFIGWNSYSNRTPIFLQFSSASTIGTQPTCDANAFRGTLPELKKLIGGEGPTVTYAPDDLEVVRDYVKTKTGLGYASLGIVAGQVQGGYHAGVDMLRQLGKAPEQPGSDYSYAESQRDRNGLTNAASAFDLGGNFPRFREITMGIVNACKSGDIRTRDIREVIYTDNGSTVKRWDRLGVRNTGDSSHLTHTHVSFFRDSDGYRDDENNFLGLVKELFDGKPTPPPTTPPVQGVNMPFAYDVQMPVKVGDTVEATIPPDNFGGFGWGPAWMKVTGDIGLFGPVSYRIALGNGLGGFAPGGNDQNTWGRVDLTAASPKWELGDIVDGTCVLSITRLTTGNTSADAIDRRLTMCVEYGPRS